MKCGALGAQSTWPNPRPLLALAYGHAGIQARAARAPMLQESQQARSSCDFLIIKNIDKYFKLKNTVDRKHAPGVSSLLVAPTDPSPLLACVLSYLLVTMAPGRSSHPPFTDEEQETQLLLHCGEAEPELELLARPLVAPYALLVSQKQVTQGPPPTLRFLGVDRYPSCLCWEHWG